MGHWGRGVEHTNLGKKHDLLIVLCVCCRHVGRWEVRSDRALMLETMMLA